MAKPLLHLRYSNLYFIILALVILIPTFPTILPGLMGFQVVFGIEVLIVLFCWFKGVFKPKATLGLIIIFSYFLLSTILALSIDLTKDISTIPDFFELAKPVAFVLFFWMYRYSIVDTESLIHTTLNAILFVFIILAIFSICSFVYPSVFRNIEFFLYKRSTVAILKDKAIGSFSTTYHFAFCLLLPLAYSYIGMVKYHNLKYIIFFMLIFCSMLLTQSRSMYLCTAVCLFICTLLPILHSSIKRSLKTIAFFICITSCLTIISVAMIDNIAENLSYAVNGFDTMLEGNNNSVNTRKAQIDWAIENNSLWLLGSGIGKGEIMLESFYALYYYRYGFIGVVIFIAIVMHIAYRSMQIAKSYPNNRYSIFFYSLAVFYFITPLSVMSSCHMDTPKISFLFYGLIGLVLNKFSHIQTKS